MTEIEDTLSRILAAEADRHEPPVFNAHRIAGAAVAKRRSGRRPLFALIAAAIATAGAGGAAVLATGGGRHRAADTVTVTIQSRTGSVSPQTTDASVKAWVRKRAAAEGLKDVSAAVQHDPWRLRVTGRAADLAALKTFGEPGILQVRPVVDMADPVPIVGPAAGPCQVSVVKTGSPWLACYRDRPTFAAWVGDPVGLDGYHVVGAQVVDLAASAGAPAWSVKVSFDTAGVKALGDYSARTGGLGMVVVLIDGAVDEARGPLPVAAGMVLDPDPTPQAADRLAAILTAQGPADLAGATVTVGTR